MNPSFFALSDRLRVMTMTRWLPGILVALAISWAVTATAQQPTGIAIAGAQAFVYNEVSRSITRIDLASQTTPDMSIASAPERALVFAVSATGSPP